MINREEVIKIAKLARLELTEEEIEKMQKDMSAILDYFEILKKAEKVSEDLSNKNSKTNTLREDKVLPKSSSLANNLVAKSPERKDEYIKVKQVL